MSRSPAAILYDADGVALAVADATAPPANTPGFIGVGYDGTYARFIRVDTSGHQYMLSNQLPAALVGGRLTVNLGSWFGVTSPTAGQKPMASSIPVAIASDQSAVLVNQGTPPWAVKGTDADGEPSTENPVLVAGQGETNVQTLRVVEIDGVKHLAAGKTNAVDPTNGTVAQLGIGDVFAPTGGTDVSQYTSVAITIHSDQDSALDGMVFEFSQDGINWDDRYSFNLQAINSQTRRFQFPVTSQYFRVNYTNGGVATTAFRIQTILHRENILTSIHRIEKVVREDRSAQLVKSAIIAQREGAIVQDFYPIQADVSGNLKVTTIGSDIPSDPSAFILVFCENSGSEDMRVDGSVTPVTFERGPTITDEVWSIRELLLTFTADDFNFDGLSFGPITALTNGFKIEIVKDAVATEVFCVKQNEDFLRVPGRTPLINNTGPKDVLGAALSFQGLVLNQADGDLVRITVQDNLTSVKLKYLTATLFAVKVT